MCDINYILGIFKSQSTNSSATASCGKLKVWLVEVSIGLCYY